MTYTLTIFDPVSDETLAVYYPPSAAVADEHIRFWVARGGVFELQDDQGNPLDEGEIAYRLRYRL